MQLRFPVIALFTALTVAACSPDQPVAPRKSPSDIKLAQLSGPKVGNYLVVMKEKGMPAGFADAVKGLGGKITSSHAGAGFATVSGLTDVSAAQLAATAGVSEVQPDAQVALDDPAPTITGDATILSMPGIQSQGDPSTAILASWQWNMELIGADRAWAAQKLGDKNVTVAILDTGMDYDNRDLIGLVDLTRSVSFMNVWVGPPGIDSTASDDSLTKTIFPTRNKITDYNGHGTNVAAQVSSKAFAFAGVGSRTTLIGVKVLGANGFGSFGGILNGVLWAADHGANIANMSLGGDFQSKGNGDLINVINQVFEYAHQKGMLIVVAAGNGATNLDHNGDTFSSFCDAPFVICVSAVGPKKVDGNGDIQAFYTNFGRRSVDVAAPGGNRNAGRKPDTDWPWGPDNISWVWSFCSRTLIVFNSTTPFPCIGGSNLFAAIGTSQASPHVAGLAALVKADNPGATPEQIKALIERSGHEIDPDLGQSRIDVANALGLPRP